MANNLLMLGLSYFRHKLFEFQAFHNQAHIINFTGIIIYFCGTYYLYAKKKGREVIAFLKPELLLPSVCEFLYQMEIITKGP